MIIYDYLQENLAIFPCHGIVNGTCTCNRAGCRDAGKHPRTEHGHKDASLDPEQVREWVVKHEDCNWGLATGAVSRVTVLDIDPRNGGDLSLQQLEQEHGELPLTVLAETGGGGKHYFFRHVPGLKSSAGDDRHDARRRGIDLKNDGGYVIVAPSRHLSGNAYRWILAPGEVPLAEMPLWLQQVLQGKPDAAKGKFTIQSAEDLSTDPGVCQGKRNDRLCHLAGKHLARGEEVDAVLDLALAWGDRCDPPLDEASVTKTVTALAKKHGAEQPPTLTVSSVVQGAGITGAVGSPVSAPADPSDPLIPLLPVLGDDAFCGLPGEIARALEPETEASSEGVLLSLLTFFGSAVGPNPFFPVQGDEHHANLFTVLVGDSASGKGVTLSNMERFFRQVAPDWADRCLVYGLSSGEGLLERVRDEETETVKDADGNWTTQTLYPPCQDKRLLVIQSEFSSLVKMARKKENPLSQLLRDSWDGRPLELLNRKKNAIKSKGHHVSLCGAITPHELRVQMTGSVDLFNGFVNRFLWCRISSTKSLPEGGNLQVLEQFFDPVRRILKHSSNIGQMKRSDQAKKLWSDLYEDLRRAPDSMTGIIDRARPQVLRLSMLYALLDGSAVIEMRHLLAAYSLWSYCKASAQGIFGDGKVQESPVNLKVLRAIRNCDGANRRRIYEQCHHLKKEALDNALSDLEDKGLIVRREDCWFASDGEQGSRGAGEQGASDPGDPLIPCSQDDHTQAVDPGDPLIPCSQDDCFFDYPDPAFDLLELAKSKGVVIETGGEGELLVTCPEGVELDAGFYRDLEKHKDGVKFYLALRSNPTASDG